MDPKLWTFILFSLRTMMMTLIDEEEENAVSRSRMVRLLYRRFRKRVQVRQVPQSRARFLLQRLAETSGYRRWWVYPRSTDWWDSFVLRVWGEEKWLENFRMTRATFHWLVDCLCGRIERQGTNMRMPIPMEERVAITIWWLANTNCYRQVGEHFGLARSTIAGIVVEVCLAIELELLESVIRPGPYGRAMDGFAKLGFPHCIGAIDGCHIQIRAPVHQSGEYINRKGFFSMLLQGTMDHSGRFINVRVGHSGKNHDAYVFRSSNLFMAMDRVFFVPGNPTVTIDGIQVPPLILGDAAYPIRKWLITPYTGALNRQQAAFNKAYCRARNAVERAFGRLKARWHCLSLKLPIQEENVVPIICACTILHNICEDRGHELTTPLVDTANEAANEATPVVHETPRVADARHKREGQAVRWAITQWMLRQRPPR
ncbi:PREDICTED: putative nuclease HARBI1 [Gekko japonicus]|uniref:Nuclease HARBI1 n=1 Tax=Gekko japonicus TaxID=146911 RepID=A0ABM1KRS9_GEKJA|nr:PREDICTED: putative nuclease HARBI1 [Gekko japonicus]